LVYGAVSYDLPQAKQTNVQPPSLSTLHAQLSKLHH